MQSADAVAQPERSSGKSVRLHYLDWLRVLAILGVFCSRPCMPSTPPTGTSRMQNRASW
jgi:hypothetical protein